MPASLKPKETEKGVSLQIWSDPTCKSSVDVSLNVDVAGSMGKLVMRYRLVFAAFPLLVVALVLREQFSAYDSTGESLSVQPLDRLMDRRNLHDLFRGSGSLSGEVSPPRHRGLDRPCPDADRI